MEWIMEWFWNPHREPLENKGKLKNFLKHQYNFSATSFQITYLYQQRSR